MMRYEYKVVPAPDRADKVKGLKDAEARFAASVERIMNAMARDGWEYQRSETLPSEERSGLTQTATVWRNLLVFRRADAREVENYAPRMLAPPEPETAQPPVVEPVRPVRRVTVASKDKPVQTGTKAKARRPAPAAEQLPSVLTARASRLNNDNGYDGI